MLRILFDRMHNTTSCSVSRDMNRSCACTQTDHSYTLSLSLPLTLTSSHSLYHSLSLPLTISATHSLHLSLCCYLNLYLYLHIRFSAAHFANSVQETSELLTSQGSPVVGILRQETLMAQGSPGSGVKPNLPPGAPLGGNIIAKPHFNVFCAESRSTDILSVEMGRQNCFTSIIIFLLKSVKTAAEASVTHHRTVGGTSGVYVSPVLRDVCLEVFQVKDMSSLLDLLDALGLDCGKGDSTIPDRYSQ